MKYYHNKRHIFGMWFSVEKLLVTGPSLVSGPHWFDDRWYLSCLNLKSSKIWHPKTFFFTLCMVMFSKHSHLFISMMELVCRVTTGDTHEQRGNENIRTSVTWLRYHLHHYGRFSKEERIFIIWKNKRREKVQSNLHIFFRRVWPTLIIRYIRLPKNNNLTKKNPPKTTRMAMSWTNWQE